MWRRQDSNLGRLSRQIYSPRCVPAQAGQLHRGKDVAPHMPLNQCLADDEWGSPTATTPDVRGPNRCAPPLSVTALDASRAHQHSSNDSVAAPTTAVRTSAQISAVEIDRRDTVSVYPSYARPLSRTGDQPRPRHDSTMAFSTARASRPSGNRNVFRTVHPLRPCSYSRRFFGVSPQMPILAAVSVDLMTRYSSAGRFGLNPCSAHSAQGPPLKRAFRDGSQKCPWARHRPGHLVVSFL